MKIMSFKKGIIVVIICLISVVIWGTSYISSQEEITITIQDKIVKVDKKKIKYLIVTENEVLHMDSLFFLNFNDLEIGKTYNVVVAGWRIPFLSYRNIVSVESRIKNVWGG